MIVKPEIAVIDTNVLMSGIIFPFSDARRAAERAFRTMKILTSIENMAECREVVRREKFDRYVSREVRVESMEDFIVAMKITRITTSLSVCRDIKDDKILELAVSGFADLIITGDKDLLSLHPFQGISILTPQAYLEL